MPQVTYHNISGAPYLFLWVALSLGSAGTVHAASGTHKSPVESWFDLLASIGRVSPMEGAGSHGSLGMTVGTGATFSPSAASNIMTREQMRHSSEGPVILPRLWISKGLPLPVDLGITAGASQHMPLTTMGAYAQWTVFEDFALPALALRGSASRVSGLESSEYYGSALEVAASYASGYITLYGTWGTSHNRSSLQIREEQDAAYLLKGNEQSHVYQKAWTIRRSSVGLRVVVVPTFFAVTMEWQGQGTTTQGYALKAALGI